MDGENTARQAREGQSASTVELPDDGPGRHLMWYALAAVLGLIAGAYACLGVIILVAPSMPSEHTLLYIYPSAVAGVVLAVLAVRQFRRRRQRTARQ